MSVSNYMSAFGNTVASAVNWQNQDKVLHCSELTSFYYLNNVGQNIVTATATGQIIPPSVIFNGHVLSSANDTDHFMAILPNCSAIAAIISPMAFTMINHYWIFYLHNNTDASDNSMQLQQSADGSFTIGNAGAPLASNSTSSIGACVRPVLCIITQLNPLKMVAY